MDWRGWLDSHRGKLIGSAAGLAVALAIMSWGLLWTLFVALCVGAGYLVGRYFDGEQDGIAEWIDRLLPPGRR